MQDTWRRHGQPAAQAVAAAPGSYQLWTAALGVPWRWPARAQWLQRALAAVPSCADAGARQSFAPLAAWRPGPSLTAMLSSKI